MTTETTVAPAGDRSADPGSTDRPGDRGAGRDRPALRRLVAGDLDEFAAAAWGREARLSRAADLAKHAEGADHQKAFGDLFDLAAVDELLSRRGLRTPFLRIAKQGQVVDSRHFTGEGGVGAEVSDQVHDDRVAALFAEGHTVVLQGVHRTWGPVADLVTDLAAELGHPAQTNAYITPASSQGFSAHYDVHDVFVLQVAGTKRWHVHAPVHPDPLRSQPWNDHADAVAARAAEEPLIDEVLEPGDALYLPRGYLHSATAQGEVSAHLTIGVHVLTRWALVDALLNALTSDPELRGSLPLGIDAADPAALAPHVEAVAARLAETLAAPDPRRTERVARSVRRRVWHGNRPETVAPLAQAAAATGADASTSVRLRRGLHHRLRPGATDGTDGTDAAVVLELPDRTLTLPAGTRDAVARLLDGDPARAGELPGLTPDDGAVVVRRLLREGVLVPV
ncbi:cupin domain-containing protein [Actinomycetospora lemnae]|uniref:Cupin domain-containing protein n=1 Tax=Actinomycetospora lemnae TaxID=3019891 RepID=A0ABT5SW18_9PSEU|nr:cupin domain-containing protein [Actinomycetospora sp. DW7H6]MDD7965913.1 cupin domain-containing protein [Actinomycetospora sp. DW7H6]